MTKYIRLSLSENPNSFPEKIKERIKKEIDDINLYPMDYYDEVKNILGKSYNLNKNNIYITNGSDEAIFFSLLTFGKQNGKVLISKKTFDGYVCSAKALKLNFEEVALVDFKVDLNAIKKSIDDNVTLIYICNPHNPTGTILRKNDLIEFISYCSLRKIKVVVDEAYMEYSRSDNSVIDFINDFDNLIVIKTFSKLYPMAGIRFGFLLSNTENIKKISTLKMLPYNVNRLACVTAIECLKDSIFLETILKNNDDMKQYVYQELNKLDIEYLKSNTNFIMIKFPANIPNFAKILLEKYRVEIKDLSELGLNMYGRLTLGKKEEMDVVFKSILTIKNNYKIEVKG